ncbi:hypothetical protein [Nitrosomonas nitrosa]|uniref:hypothetical protein n=1 Tax=Nitrosomonas nitrosa TaxID=52442 RepID=UPI00116071DA|nr:hypothetical protein [Nitrosomonas nitrosa]
MGKKEARRLSFIKEHPLCCFCGGTASAEEMDQNNATEPIPYVDSAYAIANPPNRIFGLPTD